MIKIKYLDLLVISQHYRVTIKEFIVIIFVSHTSLKMQFLAQAMERSKACPHSVKTTRRSLKLKLLPAHFTCNNDYSLQEGKFTNNITKKIQIKTN